MSIESTIRNKSDIVEYISSHNITILEKHGATIRGCCPICKGDNPTEFVASERFFHCHKCKTGGNIINFVQAYYKLPYHEAIEKLSDELNIDFDNNEQYQKEKNIVREYYNYSIMCHKNLYKIINYLENERSISSEIANEFQLGYTDNKSLLIPLHDIYGRIVANGQRQFNRKPKYINSRNNELFEKSSYLFNIHRARLLINNILYVCEGYFDAISGHSQKLPCVAYLGSELTKSQIQLIRSVCVNPETTVVICADNDEAGLSSIKRTRENFKHIAPNLSVRVLIMPKTKYNFSDGNGGFEPRVCKDLNDLHIKGIKIANIETKHIDQYCLEEILLKCPDKQTQYTAVGEFIKTVINPMIRSDIAKYLSILWEQDVDDIKKWFQVIDKPEDDLELFKTATQSMKELEEVISEGFFDLGFPSLDIGIGGVRKKDVILIGAYPSIGKTFFAGQLLLHFVLRHNLRVLFFSLEMPASALMERLASCLLGISTSELIDRVNTGELSAVYEKIKSKLDKYIRIIDKCSLTIQDINRIIKQANATVFSQPVDIIIIDYLQIMGGTSTFEDKEATAQGLKPLAKENNALVITLSQLARGLNSWERPTMNKLKGGGSIEAVGDFIFMMFKKSEDTKLTLSEQVKWKDIVSIAIEKCRRGCDLKEVNLLIDKKKTRFVEVSTNLS